MLPFQTSALIGREQEVALAQDLLRRSAVRLLTLTGPGGVGKTRLALAVATGMQSDFMDGVALVSLAPVDDVSLVVSTIAQAVGVQEAGRRPLLEQLQSHLRDRQLLLVLDNFEHLLGAAPLVSELLTACPRLKALATSRAVLRLQGEHEFAVPPLVLPDLQRLPDIAGLGQYDAVALFVARAQAMKPDFQLTDVTARAVAEICVRLDGLPLALELAATRIKVLPPRALLARLQQEGIHRLELLAGGGRDLPPRQQTLRSTLDWSYALLDASEQQLLRGLSVFMGGCTLEAAEAVARGSLGRAPASRETRSLAIILDDLQSLLDNSLLYQLEQADGEPRFMLLETIREFALEQLERNDEAPIVRRTHAAYYLQFAEAIEPALTTAEQEIGLLRLEAEQDNLRAALRWALHGAPQPSDSRPGASPDAQLGLRLAGAIWRLWLMRGYLSEGRRWLEVALERAQGQRDISVGKALHGAGVLALYHGDMMETATTSTLNALRSDLEDLWQRLDEILTSLGPVDWSRKHGKDWTYADVPYHLAYFDRDLVANGITRGPNVPADQRSLLRSMAELNAWNARKFAERPADQTVERSLLQMRASRDAIRRVVAALSDADLERPVWVPLPGTGWMTVRGVLEACIVHTWNHFMELRLRLKRSEPAPTPSQTHRALAFYVNFLPITLNRALATNTRFTAVMDITGPGGGTWTIRVADGGCTVTEEREPQPDLVMTQSVETFQATLIGAKNPMVAMLTRKINVRGMRKLATFGKLFPPPKPDTIFEASVEGTPALA